jgi:hypothetical protein
LSPVFMCEFDLQVLWDSPDGIVQPRIKAGQ